MFELFEDNHQNIQANDICNSMNQEELIKYMFFFLGYIFSNIRLRCIRYDFLHIFKQHIVLQFLEWFNLDEIRIDDK